MRVVFDEYNVAGLAFIGLIWALVWLMKWASRDDD